MYPDWIWFTGVAQIACVAQLAFWCFQILHFVKIYYMSKPNFCIIFFFANIASCGLLIKTRLKLGLLLAIFFDFQYLLNGSLV